MHKTETSLFNVDDEVFLQTNLFFISGRADKKPTKNFVIDPNTSALGNCRKKQKNPRHSKNDKDFLMGAGEGFEPTTSGL